MLKCSLQKIVLKDKLDLRQKLVPFSQAVHSFSALMLQPTAGCLGRRTPGYPMSSVNAITVPSSLQGAPSHINSQLKSYAARRQIPMYKVLALSRTSHSHATTMGRLTTPYPRPSPQTFEDYCHKPEKHQQHQFKRVKKGSNQRFGIP